jgi:hypothetical protein
MQLRRISSRGSQHNRTAPQLSAKRRRSRCAVHAPSERGDLTFLLAANISSTSSEAAAPVPARRTSWDSQHSRSPRLMRFPTPLLVAPHGVDDTLARSAFIISGSPMPLSATCPFSVDGGLALRFAADTSTIRLSAATTIPAHRASSREELESVRRTVYDADGIIVRLHRVNVDVDCDTNATIGCCAVVHACCPHIKASRTPSLLFVEPLSS